MRKRASDAFSAWVVWKQPKRRLLAVPDSILERTRLGLDVLVSRWLQMLRAIGLNLWSMELLIQRSAALRNARRLEIARQKEKRLLPFRKSLIVVLWHRFHIHYKSHEEAGENVCYRGRRASLEPKEDHQEGLFWDGYISVRGWHRQNDPQWVPLQLQIEWKSAFLRDGTHEQPGVEGKALVDR